MTAKRRPLTFVALDGEGVTRADGSHDYTLLCASDGSSIERYDAGGLPTSAIFEYLIALRERHPGAVFVMFGGAYDWQMWMRGAVVPGSREWEALDREAYISWRDTTQRDGARLYRFRAIFRHEFYLTKGHWTVKAGGGGAWTKHGAIQIWEALGWFQSTFVEAIEHWGIGTPAQRRRIADMKTRRPAFSRRHAAAVRGYCIAECEMLVLLMERVAAALEEGTRYSVEGDAAEWPGVRPARWDGPGAAARALLAREKIDRHITRPADPGVEDAVLRAYIGGRVQTFASGVLPGPVWCYDLTSAYARALPALPALDGWVRGHNRDSVPFRTLVRVRWRMVRNDARLTPLPFRTEDQSIYWPATGEGWYWLSEVQVMTRAAADGRLGGVVFEIIDSYEFGDTGRRPFAFVAALADRRNAWKAAGDPRERVLKLTINAIYGKLVQSKRAHNDRTPGRPPTYQSYIWGGMITAAIRAQVLALAAKVPADHLVAIATDAVFSMTPLYSGAAGDEWSETTIEPGLLVIQPGVMVSPAAKYVRSRGLARSSISYRRAVLAWRRKGFNAEIGVTERRFIGARYATFTGHPEHWLTWRDVPVTLSFAAWPRQWAAGDGGAPRADPRPRGSYELLYPPDVEGLSGRYHPRVFDPTSADEARAENNGVQPDIEVETGVL